MSIWAGFGAELPKAYETNRRRRVDNLNAFNEFKKSNPFATGAEFQQFIDTASGNSNYLRGGLPGKDIIAAIEKENKGNRDRRDMLRYTDQIKSTAEIDAVFGASMDQAVLNMGVDATEDDYGNAFDSFMETLPQGAGLEDFRKKARTRFNVGNRGKLVTGRIRDNLQDALTFVKSSAGTDVTAKNLSEYFGLPMDVAEGLHARTTELHGQEQQKLQLSNYEGALSQGLRLLQATPTMDVDALTAQLKTIYGGSGMDTDFSSDFFKQVSSDALEKKRIETDDRNRTILTGARRTAMDVKEAMRKDAITQTSIIANDKSGWTKNYLAQMEDNLSDEEFKAFYGVDKGALEVSKFYDEWDELVEISRASQRKEQETTRIAGGQAAIEAAQSYRETNNARADDVFAWAKDTGKGVETILSQSYDMNPFFAQAAAEMTNRLILQAGEGDPLTPQQIVQQIRGNAEVMGLTGPITDAANNYGKQMLQINGAFDVETAEDYFTGFQTEFTEKFNEFENYVSLVMASELSLEQKQTLLTQVQSESNQFASTSMNNHIQRERRQDRWVLHGTGGYNAERHDALGQEVDGMSVGLGSFLEQSQLKIKQQMVAEAENPDVSSETSQVATPLFNTTLTEVLKKAEEFTGDPSSKRYETLSALKQATRRAAWPGRNAENKDTWQQHEALKFYLDYNLTGNRFSGMSVQDKIAVMPDEYNSFIADPIGHMLADEEFLAIFPDFADMGN